MEALDNTEYVRGGLFEDKESGNRFYFFNIHLDSKGSQGVKLIKDRIRQLTDDGPVIVTGDFNFTPNSKPYMEITSDNPIKG